MHQLNFFRGSRPFFQVRLQSSSTKIGRLTTCDVVLAEPEISREHAVIYNIDGQFLIKRVGKASVLVNGQNIESHTLKNNDRIQLGPWEASFIEIRENSAFEETQVTQVGFSNKTQIFGQNSGPLAIQEMVLKIRQPSKPDKTFSFQSSTILLGSDPKNDIVLEDPYISGRHLKVVCEDQQVWIYDLNSTNGTYLHNTRIRETQLPPEVPVRIGQCELVLLQSKRVSPEMANPTKTGKFFGMVGQSPGMKHLQSVLEKAGPTDATVLILGESGSGKELIANAVHQLSARAKNSFVAINCGAISKELIESELFGHEKGAFTGAQTRHNGAFGQAEGGTIFLDEIGELPLDLQPKLLRVLENRRYRRVGGAEELMANVRVVAATHRDLADLVKAKRFREDLFFRLFVLPVCVSPLRERMDDLPLLIDAFLEEFSPSHEKKILSAEAMEKLKRYNFPGNVRELRNILLRGVVLSQKKEIGASEIIFPQTTEASNFQPIGFEKLEEMERHFILQALQRNQWNKAKTAEALGIAKSTLFSKIKLYQLEGEAE